MLRAGIDLGDLSPYFPAPHRASHLERGNRVGVAGHLAMWPAKAAKAKFYVHSLRR